MILPRLFAHGQWFTVCYSEFAISILSQVSQCTRVLKSAPEFLGGILPIDLVLISLGEIYKEIPTSDRMQKIAR